MGKLILIAVSAAAGFVAAIAATPDDEVRRAYDHGFAEGKKALQGEAVKCGHATWEKAGSSAEQETFTWTSHQPRWRGDHEMSNHEPRPRRSEERGKRDLGRFGAGFEDRHSG